jgi:alpha-mannosidase
MALISLCSSPAAAQPRAAAGGSDVYVVPFSHLDLMWAGTREECLSRGCRIIDKAIGLATRHPEFRFLLEDEVFAANYVDAHRGSPELDQFRRLVKDGRIEIAPKWAAIYENLPRGEALVRNVIYGKQYAREVFRVDPQVAHLGDVPGFTSQLPQILAKSDTPFMVMTRMGPPECSLFRYKSPDGSTALVWNTIKGYAWGVGLGLHRDRLDEPRIANIAQAVQQVQATTRGPVYLGWGTDLFAPSENLLTNVALLNQRLAPVRFRFATPTEFFRAASKLSDIPEFSGEIPSSWGNLLTSMCHLWPPTTAATDTLLTAEKFAAINYALGYADYPQDEFESLWKCALEAMDHNNFGQGGDIGDARKLEYAAAATMRSGQILRDSLRNLAERVHSPIVRSTPIVVFNPSSWQRDDVVHAHVSVYGDVSPGDIADYKKATRLVDEMGASVPFHVEQSYGTVSRAFEIVFVARGVPALGYKTYSLAPADKAGTFLNACQVKLDEVDGRTKRIRGTDQIEDGFYRVTVDRSTGRITVFDKGLDRAVAKDIEIVGAEERGGDSLSVEPLTGRTLIFTVHRVELEENNPVRAVLRIDGGLGGVPITQRLRLYGAVKRIDLENTIDWKPGGLMKIEQHFPYDHADAQVRYGIPFGSAAGSDILPNSGPHARDEIPRDQWKGWRQIQDWIFAGTSDWGVTLAADRPFVVLGDGLIRFDLLRGTFSTTVFTRAGKPVLLPVPPAGQYVFRYALTSGRGDWKRAQSHRFGMALSNPLIPVSAVDELSSKSLPPTHSFCSLGADNLVVTALKKAQREEAIVLRVVEVAGAQAHCPVQFLGENRAFQPVNLLEEPARPGDERMLRINPYEISTVRLPVSRMAQVPLSERPPH